VPLPRFQRDSEAAAGLEADGPGKGAYRRDPDRRWPPRSSSADLAVADGRTTRDHRHAARGTAVDVIAHVQQPGRARARARTDQRVGAQTRSNRRPAINSATGVVNILRCHGTLWNRPLRSTATCADDRC
jgi:hypothetical protein